MKESFYIKPEPMFEVINEYTSMKKELEKNIHDLEKVKANLSGSAYGEVSCAIGVIIKDLNENKKSLNSMQSSLRTIVFSYLKVEKNLLEWIKEFIDRIFGCYGAAGAIRQVDGVGIVGAAAGSLLGFEIAQSLGDEGGGEMTLVQLKNILMATNHFRANNVTLDMLNEINRVLKEYNICTEQEIQMFLSVGIHETYISTTEAGWLSVDAAKKYCARYEPDTELGKNLGNTKVGDGYKFRGAGYIQLTGRYNYQKFSDYIEEKYGYDPEIMQRGADYVAEKYAWEAAGYYWEQKNINETIQTGNDKNLNSEEIFRQVSNAVNRGNANSSKDPGEWNDRKQRFNEVLGAY